MDICNPLSTYYTFGYGSEMYGVFIDKSAELDQLVLKARRLRPLPFDQKLQEVRRLAREVMRNAYEGSLIPTNTREEQIKCSQIVHVSYPLSHALKQQRGCCRYQAILFFILSYEARLGDAHFIQTYPLSGRVSTCYNEVIDIETQRRCIVSIFLETLVNPEYDYSKNTRIFQEPAQPSGPSLSYRKIQGGTGPVFEIYSNRHGPHRGNDPTRKDLRLLAPEDYGFAPEVISKIGEPLPPPIELPAAPAAEQVSPPAPQQLVRRQIGLPQNWLWVGAIVSAVCVVALQHSFKRS